MTERPLRGRRALVTGASRRQGIGFAVARRLVAHGADVCVHHHRPHDERQPWGPDDLGQVLAELRAAAADGATVADVVAHCEHIREVAGVEHIGLGGDYDGVVRQPDGLEDVSCYPALLSALAERGWSDDDLHRLTHRNVIDTLRAAEAVAAGSTGSVDSQP